MSRVVVTGLGVISPLGNSLKESWKNLLEGSCGIVKLTNPLYDTLPCKIAAVINIPLEEYFSKSELRTISSATALGLLAAKEALLDAKWEPKEEKDFLETGVAVGTGMVDLDDICKTNKDLETRGYNRVSPYFVPRILPNMISGSISIKYGFRGPNHAVSTACATGAHSIGDAYRMIERGDAKVMVAGGAEKCVSQLSIAGFCRLRALSTAYNDSPHEASRPFDLKRDGFVMGEGSAIVILEEKNHAEKRGAPIYGEILGYGLSGDASHLTAPRDDGSGAILAMSRALKNISLDDVGLVNAHATSTPLGDAIEARAISKLLPDVMVTSTKGSHGHLLGAAGNLESIFTIMSCHTGIIPPTINYTNPDPNCKINLVANVKKEWNADKRRIALKNSFGFGGTNASLCIAQYNK